MVRLVFAVCMAIGLALSGAATAAPTGDHDKELSRLIAKAKAGGPEQWHALGLYYSAPHEGEPAWDKAASWIGKAAEQGYPESLATYGQMHFDGLGVPQDAYKASLLMMQAGLLGHERATVILGAWYEGKGPIPKDDGKAHFWHMRAAVLGDVPSQRRTGLDFMHGIGVLPSDAQAFAWLLLAQQNGDAGSGEALALIEERRGSDWANVRRRSVKLGLEPMEFWARR